MSVAGDAPTPRVHSSERPLWTWIRRGIALTVLAFSLGGLLLDKFHTCTVESTIDKTLTTCVPPTITDASVVAVAVLFLALILPDFDEISAVGVSMKRRIEAVDRRTDELQSSFALLSAQVSQATANASVVNNLSYLPPENSLDKIAARLAAKLENVARTGSSETTVPDGELSHGDGRAASNRIAAEVGPDGTVRALLSQRLIVLWEQLQEILLLGPRYRPARDSRAPASRMAEEFAEEIATVRRARNSVAHAQAISSHDIKLAVDAAEKLIEIAHLELG